MRVAGGVAASSVVISLPWLGHCFIGTLSVSYRCIVFLIVALSEQRQQANVHHGMEACL